MVPAVKVNVMNRHFPHRAGSRVGDEPTTAPGRFAAFGNRNFRLYFVGQTISSIGSWAQSLAVTWLVLDLTDRSDQLGIALALQFLPMLILGAPAGVLADRLDNRRLLLATSAASGVLALTFGIVVTTGHATIWWIYALTFALGLVLAVVLSTMPLAALASPAAASANPYGNSQCVYHWVKPGETLSGIASRYGVNMWTIAQRNGISNPNRIYAGQKLLIYCTTPKPPPPPRSAQNRSGCSSGLAMRTRPSAVTTSKRSTLSTLIPYLRASQPSPPPSV